MSEQKEILRTEHLTIKFGGLVANNDVNIHLNEGEILGLIGTNGAGKTTLFNMLAGALKPTSGKIYYRGQDITGKPADKICKMGIGRTYQVVQPFTSLTVEENVMVGCLNRHRNIERARKRADEILEELGLGKHIHTKGANLGLPQLKRMEIARALATEPDIILLDEVMAGLNPTECEEAMELVLNLRKKGYTIIMIEHIMKAVMNVSDRIYVLNQGVVIAEGTPQEVSTNQEVIDSYLGGAKKKC
ncbi:MAG: ABC transporter ATP-binding protein [Oscillibacter sp.]|nr:ABC transporter ATP-binding protein [Oscillibacter sp.]